jgi:hypothetical protein
VSWVWIALLALAVAVLIGAEWPRLEKRFGGAVPKRRRRSRRRPKLEVIASDEQDDFAASVERDLSLLPTIDEDDRPRRR